MFFVTLYVLRKQSKLIYTIETMNDYNDLAAKARAKSDAILEAIKEEMVRQNAEELAFSAYVGLQVHFSFGTVKRSGGFRSFSFTRFYRYMQYSLHLYYLVS